MVAVEEVATSHPGQKFLGKEFALLDRYELQDALVDTLQKTVRHRHRAEALLNCHRTFRGRVCRSGHRWAKAEKSCSLRICPHCCRARSAEVAARLEPFLLSKPKNSLRYMVLSERNCTDLAEGMASIWAAFTLLRRSVGWKRKVKGCVVAFEVTVRPNGEWHPHLNVLIEGEYYPQQEAVQSWMQATKGRGEIVWISAITPTTSRELIKYVTKSSDLVGNPAALEAFLDAVYNRRLLRTYGTFFGLKLEEEVLASEEICPDCGTHEFVTLGLVKPQQVSMDFKGVLRMKKPSREVDREIKAAVSFHPTTPREEALVNASAFNRMRKSWRERGVNFEDSHAEWIAGVERVRAIKVNVIAGWGYSEFLAKLQRDDTSVCGN